MPNKPPLESFLTKKPVVSTTRPSLESFQTIENNLSQKIFNSMDDADVRSAEQYGASFPAKTGEGPLAAGLKAIGNVPSSAFNLGKNIVSAAVHPAQTVKGLAQVATGGVEKLIPGEQGSEQAFDAFTNALKERYGSLENLQRTATNDPFGFGADILTVLGGGTQLLKVAGVKNAPALLHKGIEKTGQLVTKPTVAVAKGITKAAKSTVGYGVSQATGLEKGTIEQIIKSPDEFTAHAQATNVRSAIADDVYKVIQKNLNDLSDTGKLYNEIRQAEGNVTIPQTGVKEILERHGLQLNDENKILQTAESVPISSVDKSALESFIGTYGKEETLSNNAFLNTRKALDNLAKYETGKTDAPRRIARELRSFYDNLGKNQIEGLKQLDETYAPQVKQLNKLKKDYFTSTGEFKDGAINKIANLTGKGKDATLARLEQIMPGAGQRIKVMKAVEDIQAASGMKVGTYIRGGIAVGGAATGNVPLIVGAIIAQPEIAVPLLRGYGKAGKAVAPIVEGLQKALSDINNFRLPAIQPRGGLSMEDISSRVKTVAAKLDDTDRTILSKYWNKINQRQQLSIQESNQVDSIFEGIGKELKMDLVNASLSDQADIIRMLMREAPAELTSTLEKSNDTIRETTISKDLESLAAEAKNFKSANEFVESMTQKINVPIGFIGKTKLEELQDIIKKNFKTKINISSEELGIKAKKIFDKAKIDKESWARGRKYDSVIMDAMQRAMKEVSYSDMKSQLIDFYNKIMKKT